jgi:hypothetical protein
MIGRHSLKLFGSGLFEGLTHGRVLQVSDVAAQAGLTLVEHRRPIFRLEPWIRRHIRKCFWLRWHSAAGRERHLRALGVKGQLLKVAFSSKGAWPLAVVGGLHKALPNAVLRRHQFFMPSDLAAR